MVELTTVKYGQDITTIGVISDTHIPSRGRFIPPEVFRLFKDVQLILHAGDLVDEQVIEELKILAPVEAVAGNMDPASLQNKLGQVKVIKTGLLSIGLLHGDFMGRQVDPEQLSSVFNPVKLQAVVFGHLHKPVYKMHKGTLYFNPGSVIDPRRSGRPTCGKLFIDGDSIAGEVISL